MRHLLIVFLIAIAGIGCGRDKKAGTTMSNTLVHAYLTDIDHFNPILVTDGNSRDMTFLTFPHLMEESFDTEVGIVEYSPYVATSWKFDPSFTTLTFSLRSDIVWSDGKPVTAHDWKFSYRLYADSIVASTRQNFCDIFVKLPNGNIDFERAIEIPDPYTLILRFEKPTPKHIALKYTNLAFLPEHHWKEVSTLDLRSNERNFNDKLIVTSGPYKMQKWERGKELVLVANPDFKACPTPKIERFVMRSIPEYTTRLTLLKTGAADMVQSLTPDDARRIQNDSLALIYERGYMFYDMVNWLNIDPDAYTQKVIKPHPLFGSKKVRRALTLAIDRQSIIDGHLLGYGKMAVSDVVPLCKWALHPDLKPLRYDPEAAKKLLIEEGWKSGPNGILLKNGIQFSFTLFINAGNQRRNYAATVIQQNLRAIGIDCKIQAVDSNVLQEQIRKRKLDAFIFGFVIAPPDVDPSETRFSDLERTPYNQTGFQHKRVDRLIELSRNELEVLNTAPLWREYSTIIADEQPETILYWFTNLTGISRRVVKAYPSPVSSLDKLYLWEIAP